MLGLLTIVQCITLGLSVDSGMFFSSVHRITMSTSACTSCLVCSDTFARNLKSPAKPTAGIVFWRSRESVKTVNNTRPSVEPWMAPDET
jgi:hypothetical protein